MSIRTTYGIYINARVHARRAELLTKPRYEEILQCADTGNIVRWLLAHPGYEKDMAEALLHGEGANAIEEAAGRNLDREFELLARIVRREPLRAEAMSYFMHRWDLAAIKSLLRRGVRGEGGANFGLVTGPSLPWPVLQKYAGQVNSLENAVQLMAAHFPWLCGRLPALLAARNEERPGAEAVAVLETALDRRYFERCADWMWNGPRLAPVRAYLRLEVDRINLRAVLSDLLYGARSAEGRGPWLRGGTLDTAQLDAFAASGSFEQATIMLENTSYRALHQVFSRVQQTGQLGTLDRRFEMLFVEWLGRRVHQDPFGLPLFMEYVWLKWIECANLRVLARGAEAKLPSGRVREELICLT